MRTRRTTRCLLAALFAVLALGSSANTAYTWKAVSEDPDNVISNAAHFFNGSTPLDPSEIASTDSVIFNDKYRLTLPAGSVYECPYGVRIIGAKYCCLTVDLANAVWYQPDRGSGETAYTNDDRFRFNLNRGGAFFQYAYTGNLRCGAFALSNALFRLEQKTDQSPQLLAFDRGLFNFLDPNGESRASNCIYFGAVSSVPEIRFEFAPAAEFRCGDFYDYGTCRTNVFDFAGSSHFINSLRIQKRNAAEPEPCRSKYLIHGDGTFVQMCKFQTASGNNDHSYAFNVFSNATLYASDASGYSQTAGMSYPFRVYDGGVMQIGYNGTFPWVNPCLSVSNATFDAAIKPNSTMRFDGGRADIRKDAIFKAMTMTMRGSGGVFCVDGGTATIKALTIADNDGSSSEFRIASGLVSVTNSAITVVGSNGSTGSLVLDGGVLEAKGIVGGSNSRAQDASKTGEATLKADGGTVRALGASATFVSGLTEASVGAGGLAIESDYDVTIPQSFADLDGASGVLTLSGSGTKTLSGTATTVSKIAVAGGTVVFAAGSRAASELTVVSGAKVVFVEDPSAIGFTGLNVGDALSAGVLSFSLGQTLSVAGDVDLRNVRVALDGDFAIGSTTTLVSASGDVSAGSTAAWEDALIVSGRVAGRSYGLSATSDGGVTSFCMSVSNPILIEQASGEREVATPVNFGANEIVVASVLDGATLTVSGDMGNGALDKTGGGRLFLNGDNLFLGAINSYGGLFSVLGMGAFGYSADGTGLFRLVGGTFEYRGGSGAYPGSFVVDSPWAVTSVVIKTDSPLTLSNITVSSGCIVKRGVEPLVIDPGPGTETVLSVSEGFAKPPAPPYGVVAFDGQGTAPAEGYSGFTVIEGDVTLKGDATTTISIPNTVQVGGRIEQLSAQPSLTVDGARVTLGSGGSSWVYVCPRNSQTTDLATCPRFTVRNGAYATCGTFAVGNGVNYPAYSYPTVTVERATLEVNNLMAGYSGYCYGRILLDGANLYAKGIDTYGVSYLDATNTVFAKNSGLECITAANFNQTGDGGTWTFRAGSVLYLAKFKNKTSGLTFRFDGASWETGGGDYPTFKLYRSDKMTIETFGAGGLELPVAEGKTVTVEKALTGAGPVVKTGGGALVFGTAGDYDEAQTAKTPLEDPVTLAFDGELDVRGGTVSVAATACRTGGVYRAAAGTSVDFGGNSLDGATFAGGGTFSSLATAGTKISVVLGDDGTVAAAPTFASATFSGRTTVDFGRGDEPPQMNPAPQVVAHVPAGTSLSGWRARNVGRGLRATFAIDAGGTVTAEIASAGMLLIVK